MLSATSKRTVIVVLLSIALVGSTVAFGAVAQTDDGVDEQQSAQLRVVHASPDAPAVDVLVDGETALEDVSFGDVSDYLSLEAGNHDVTIAAADDPDTVVFEGELTLEPGSATTLAASGEISEDAATSFEPVGFVDNASAPADDESAVRVVHLAPDAPAVDVTAADGSVVLADNVSFRNASDYASVPAGDYTVEIRAATEGNDGPVVTTVDVSLEGGTAYSALAVGYLAPDEAPADTPFEVILTEDVTASEDGSNGEEETPTGTETATEH